MASGAHERSQGNKCKQSKADPKHREYRSLNKYQYYVGGSFL